MSKKLTPLSAVKAYCRQCSGESPKSVKLCPISNCSLYPYREGHNPARKGVGPRVTPFASKSGAESTNSTSTEVLNESRAV